MATRQFKVLVEQDEDGIFVVSVPSLPGCHTQGKTYEEVMERVQEAIELCLEVAEKDSGYRKQISTFQPKFLGISEVAVRA